MGPLKDRALAVLQTYCTASTAHGVKYIVSETALIVKTLWVGSFSSLRLQDSLS